MVSRNRWMIRNVDLIIERVCDGQRGVGGELSLGFRLPCQRSTLPSDYRRQVPLDMASRLLIPSDWIPTKSRINPIIVVTTPKMRNPFVNLRMLVTSLSFFENKLHQANNE